MSIRHNYPFGSEVADDGKSIMNHSINGGSIKVNSVPAATVTTNETTGGIISTVWNTILNLFTN